MICEGCGSTATKSIHVTNGVLRLCQQCLDDINRKSPSLEAAQAKIQSLEKDMTQLGEDLRGALAASYAEIVQLKEQNVQAEEGWRRSLDGLWKLQAQRDTLTTANERMRAGLLRLRLQFVPTNWIDEIVADALGCTVEKLEKTQP